MRIFRHDLTPAERAPETVSDGKPWASMDLWVRCDRCRVAEAKVEVITDAGPVFLCQHHHSSSPVGEAFEHVAYRRPSGRPIATSR